MSGPVAVMRPRTRAARTSYAPFSGKPATIAPSPLAASSVVKFSAGGVPVYPSGDFLIGAPIPGVDAERGAAVAYSATSQRFLVVWHQYGGGGVPANDLRAQLVSTSAALVGTVINVSFDNHFQGEVGLDWSPATNQFLLAYRHFYEPSGPATVRSLYLEVRWRGGDVTGDVLEILDYGAGMASFTQTPQSASTGIVDADEAGVLAVGAIDPPASGTIAGYSSQGPTNDGRIAPDIAAAAAFASTVKAGGFAGTSAAA